MKRELIWSKALDITKKAIDCGAVIPFETIKYNSDSLNSVEEEPVLLIGNGR